MPEADDLETKPNTDHDPDAAGAGDHPTVDDAIEDPEVGRTLLPFPVVAMGASAGGLEAYMELLGHLPPDTGLSFVVISHLLPDTPSHLSEILGRHTVMPVREIHDGMAPEANAVYVLPPNARAVMVNGCFLMEPRPAGERIPMPIDRFFRSLATDQRHRAVGVILSGADSDGALGLQAIKGEGGIAIVQDPDSARFGDMPRSGILADHVDLVLSPADIASELARLARQFYQPSLQLLEEGNVAPGDEPHFARCMALLRTVAGIDFRNYKPGTIRRRIARRMVLRRMDTLPEYVRFLQESREELRNLHEDCLINVTRFFRDPSVFDALKSDVLPGIFEGRPVDQQVRVWVAGCSTGEETYSIAITLLEYLAGQPYEPPIQIFGTDASDRAIDKARTGLYPNSLATEVSPERLRRFFMRTDKGYQVAKRVRDLCIFARQNLCSDPPFSRLDIVSCRNVLIYLNPDIQRSITTTFHYALRPSGCLLLGRSESIAESLGLFTPIDRRNRFYAKLGETRAHLVKVPRLLPEMNHVQAPPALQTRNSGLESDLQRAADRVVLARHGPPGVLVNGDLDVLEVRGRPAPFLEIAPGTPSLHLLRMAHGDIMPTLRDAIRRATESGVAVVEQVTVHSGEEIHEANLEVLPMHVNSVQGQHFLILFARPAGRQAEPPPPVQPEEPVAGEEDAQRELSRIRRDLTTTRLYLQSLIEERDGRNQELTAAYEEIQSANEELQSTNEELETAKEELQSTNEELQTVNDELRNRNQALLQTSNDLNNLLNSVNIPVVMMSSDLAIRQFTPPAERLMRLRAADIGRPISEIRLNLQLEDLEPLLHEVLETLATRELEVQDRSGRWHMLRLRPYRTTDNKIEGVVMLLLDIDQMRRGQEEVQQARDFAQGVVEAVQVPVAVLDSQLRIRTANAAFRTLTSLGTTDLEKHSFSELLTVLWGWPDLRQPLQALIGGSASTVLRLEHETDRPPARNFTLAARVIVADGEAAVLIVMEDVSAQRRAERLLESDRERLAGQVQSTAEVLGRTREELRALTGRLFTSQEEERRRVARELHDDINHKLAILEIDIERLRQNLPPDPEGIRNQLQNLRERTAQLSTDVRDLSRQLHPSSLEHFGLPAALRTLVEDFAEREGMMATFRQSSVPDELPLPVAGALYRITQEALRNVGRHAGRTHVKVTLERTEEGLRLVVRDLGEGFDTEGSARRGLGLVSMEERARLIGGRFCIESNLGEGTTVTVTVPVTEQAHA